jgi:Uma2 family endonuclease
MATTLLSLEQYRQEYASQSGWEYRDGEAIRKPVPTDLHGILQYVLCDLLWEAGYISSVEVDLRIVSHWEPRPDVVGTLDEHRAKYPTEPVEIVAEILSDDQMTVLLKKCRDYASIGIPQIFVLDPGEHTVWIWNAQSGQLDVTVDLKLGNGATIPGVDLWQRFETRRHRKAR